VITTAANPHRRPGCRTALTGILALTLTLLARADSVKMPNGETLHGTIVRETADYVVFHSASFGEIKIPRAPGMTLAHATASVAPDTASAAPAIVSAPIPAAAPPAGGAPSGPGAEPPSGLKQFLGLSDRWSLELEANLLVQNDKFHATAHGTELTVGYRVPNETKPTQPLHEYGFFAAHNFQSVDSTVVGKNTEVAVRYFYQPLSSWLLVSQADWMTDRINGIESRSHVLAIPSYRFIDTPRTRLLTGIGPSYLSDTRLVATGPTTTVKNTDAGFRIGFYELFLQTLTPALKFRQTLIVLGRPDAFSSTYNLRLEASLRRQLTPHLSLNFAYDYVRDENTAFTLESVATLKLMLGYRF
jgi:putative salt-induced outer membrane protein YdiY